MKLQRGSVWKAAWIVTGALCAAQVHGQTGWRPEKAVEIITSSAAGGSNDQVARAIQRIMQDQKSLPTPILVVNKPGGNQTLAVAYLNQYAGNGHYTLLANPTLFTNQIQGITAVGYKEVTPIANLLTEHTVFSVHRDSPLRNVRDLMDKLRADPDSLVVGIVSRGGPNHLAFSVALKAAGIDPRRVKAVVFKTNAESMTAMVGGHLQLVASSISSALGQVQAGNARMLAVVSPQRIAGIPDVPTLKEQGLDAYVANWRAMFGPKGMTPQQVATWQDALSRAVATPEWKAGLEKNHWSGNFLRGDDFVRYLDTDYSTTRAIMAEIGLAKGANEAR